MEKRDSAIPATIKTVSEKHWSHERLSRKYHWSYLYIEIRCCVTPILLVVSFIVFYWFDHVHCEFSKHDLEMPETNRQIITTICQGSISSSSWYIYLSGDQRPGFTHVHLDENQVTELDYTYGPGPGDQVAALHGQGDHHGSPDHTDHSLAHHQDSRGERVTAGVTLPFLHQVGLCASMIGSDTKYWPLIGCLECIVIPIRTRSLTLTTASH